MQNQALTVTCPWGRASGQQGPNPYTCAQLCGWGEGQRAALQALTWRFRQCRRDRVGVPITILVVRSEKRKGQVALDRQQLRRRSISSRNCWKRSAKRSLHPARTPTTYPHREKPSTQRVELPSLGWDEMDDRVRQSLPKGRGAWDPSDSFGVLLATRCMTSGLCGRACSDYVTDFLQQLRLCEWLREKRLAGLFEPAAHRDRIVGIARDVQNLRFRV